jgi:hypothetical protein
MCRLARAVLVHRQQMRALSARSGADVRSRSARFAELAAAARHGDSYDMPRSPRVLSRVLRINTVTLVNIVSQALP